MVFSGAVFLYAFLPLTLAVYALAPQRGRNAVLLIASLLFYAFGEPVYVFLLLLSSVSNWALSLCIERRRGTRTAKLALAVSVLLNLGLLGFFKYADFFLTTVNGLFGLSLPLTGVRLPLGISFYTFQTMSYTIDVYRGHVRPQRNLATFATFVCLFPQLIAGPIVRYSDIEAELHTRRFCLEDIGTGARRFTVGLGKKVLLANVLGELVSSAGNATVLGAWLGAVGYLLQIYFDFSGYSDMAIGLGRMFGFHFLENFNYPYISLSVTEFWRRWHISLSTWFRDYVYIPLGGNRVSRGKWVRNILVVWGLTGLWHGADWNFLLWGLYYGVLLLIEKLWLGKYLERLPKALRWLLCMIIVCIGWVMFNLTDFVQMRCALARMFSFTHVALSQSLAADVSIVPPLLWMLPALVFSTPVCRRVHLGESCGAEIVRNVVCLALLAVCIVFSVSATFNPFIYFRF